MQAHGTLKKWVVDNKLDKDHCPDPKITMTIEIPFHAYRAKALADLTCGDTLNFKVEKTQMGVPYNPVGGEVDPEEPTDPLAPLLLNDSPDEAEAETEGGEPEEPLDQAAEA